MILIKVTSTVVQSQCQWQFRLTWPLRHWQGRKRYQLIYYQFYQLQLRFGSDKLKKEFLEPSISGDQVACLGVSEPGAGSDVAR